MTDTQQHLRLIRSWEIKRKQLAEPADPRFVALLPILAGVPEKARLKVAEKLARFMHVMDFPEGSAVLERGSYTDSAYYILEGTLSVDMSRGDGSGAAQLANANRPRRSVTTNAEGMLSRSTDAVTVMLDAPPAAPGAASVSLGPGDIVGEMGALSRYAVSATVRAATAVRVLRIHIRGLRTLTMTSKEFKAWLDGRYRERALAGHLRQIPLFEAVDTSFLTELCAKVELVSFDQGQVIVEEGSVSDSLYLVRGGYVKVSVRAGTGDLAVTYLRKGDCAGESALLLDVAWPFSLSALESVEMVKISKADATALLARYPVVSDVLWSRVTSRLKDRGAALRQPVASGHLQMAMDTGLMQGESVLLIDLNTCTRCDDCVRGCADAHGGEPRFVRSGQRYRNWLVPVGCYQCTDPVCMVDCPTGAISRDFGELVVTINDTDHPTQPCIGCGNCATRCPWKNIVMVDRGVRADGKPQQQATKCDLCASRPEGPACVQMCPHGSAVRVSFRDPAEVLRILQQD